MATLLTIKATLAYTKPAVWRRLAVPDTLTFWELHFVLQLAFNWENSHLFEFSTGRGSPGELLTGTPPTGPSGADYLPEWWRDPREVPLGEILTGPKAKVSYVYDLGDHWEHQLVVEKTEPLAAAPLPPVVCLAGCRAAPPEDIGGLPGYYMLLEALAEKATGQRRRMPSEFAGLGKYDPDDARLPLVNESLAQLPAIMASENALLAEYQALATRLPHPVPPPAAISLRCCEPGPTPRLYPSKRRPTGFRTIRKAIRYRGHRRQFSFIFRQLSAASAPACVVWLPFQPLLPYESNFTPRVLAVAGPAAGWPVRLPPRRPD